MTSISIEDHYRTIFVQVIFTYIIFLDYLAASSLAQLFLSLLQYPHSSTFYAEVRVILLNEQTNKQTKVVFNYSLA